MNVKFICGKAANHGNFFSFLLVEGVDEEVFLKQVIIFGIRILWRAHLNHRPQHMAGRQLIRNREDKTGLWNFLPSWYTFRTFCLRSQFFLVQNQIAEIQYFYIILREKSDSTWIQQTGEKH